MLVGAKTDGAPWRGRCRGGGAMPRGSEERCDDGEQRWRAHRGGDTRFAAGVARPQSRRSGGAAARGRATTGGRSCGCCCSRSSNRRRGGGRRRSRGNGGVAGRGGEEAGWGNGAGAAPAKRGVGAARSRAAADGVAAGAGCAQLGRERHGERSWDALGKREGRARRRGGLPAAGRGRGSLGGRGRPGRSLAAALPRSWGRAAGETRRRRTRPRARGGGGGVQCSGEAGSGAGKLAETGRGAAGAGMRASRVGRARVKDRGRAGTLGASPLAAPRCGEGSIDPYDACMDGVGLAC